MVNYNIFINQNEFETIFTFTNDFPECFNPGDTISINNNTGNDYEVMGSLLGLFPILTHVNNAKTYPGFIPIISETLMFYSNGDQVYSVNINICPPIPVICFYHKTLLNGKNIKDIKIGDKFKLARKEKYITLKNIHILPQNQINTFIKIPPHSIRHNLPTSELIVTEDHELLVNGFYMKAKKLLDKFKEVSKFTEIVEYNFMLEMEEFGTTREHHFIEINGMEVGVWGCDHLISKYVEYVEKNKFENMYKSHRI